MKIRVETVYENMGEEQIARFKDSVFDSSWAAQEFPPEQLEEMKADFLKGEVVGVKSMDPAGSGMSVTTHWKLEK